MSEKEKIELERGGGNIFRDFGVANADVQQAKAKLAARIIGTLDDLGLSVREAHKRTGFAAADFSRIRNADLDRFTIDRMIKILHSLDDRSEVILNVRHRPRQSREATADQGF